MISLSKMLTGDDQVRYLFAIMDKSITQSDLEVTSAAWQRLRMILGRYGSGEASPVEWLH